MFQETIDILRPQAEVTNAIVYSIRQSTRYNVVSIQPQHIICESCMTFFDFGCLFDIFIYPISSNQTRLVVQGRLNYGFDMFNFVKKRWRDMLELVIFSLNLNNNQIFYYGSY